MAELLTEEDIFAITKRKSVKAQKDRLRELNIPFFDIVGETPSVTWTAVNNVLLNTAITRNTPTTPNMEAL